MPPAAPEARKPFPKDIAETAPMIGILPGFGADSEVAFSDDADEERGGEGEDGTESGVGAGEADEEAVGFR